MIIHNKAHIYNKDYLSLIRGWVIPRFHLLWIYTTRVRTRVSHAKRKSPPPCPTTGRTRCRDHIWNHPLLTIQIGPLSRSKLVLLGDTFHLRHSYLIRGTLFHRSSKQRKLESRRRQTICWTVLKTPAFLNLLHKRLQKIHLTQSTLIRDAFLNT